MSDIAESRSNVPNKMSENEQAIRSALRRVSFVGGVSVGLSPWIYMIGMLIVHTQYNLEKLTSQFEPVQAVFTVLCFLGCVISLPMSLFVQWFLAQRVKKRTQTVPEHVSGLSATGIVSLTVVHLPAVLGLLYFILTDRIEWAFAMEIWAFATYLPMQWWINHQIKRTGAEI